MGLDEQRSRVISEALAVYDKALYNLCRVDTKMPGVANDA